MNKKDNRSTGAMVVSLTFAVVVFTALYIQHQSALEPNTVIETRSVLEDVNILEPEMINGTVVSDTDVLVEKVTTPESPGVISFAKTYAIAREAFGPDQTFTWNGMLYSTNTIEEATAKGIDAQSDINLTDAQDSLVNALSHAITPKF